MTNAKVQSGGKIRIEKKKLVERKRKLISASTGCKRVLLIWHHRKWCLGYACAVRNKMARWLPNFEDFFGLFSLLRKANRQF